MAYIGQIWASLELHVLKDNILAYVCLEGHLCIRYVFSPIYNNMI